MLIDETVMLSILIVNWNVKNFLRDCIESIYEKTCGIKFEIIVVDNASSDSSVDMVRAEFPQVRLIESRENVGFGKANNLAVKIAKGKYIGLLNPDTVLMNDAFSIMIAQLETNSKIGLIGPKLMSVDGVVQKTCARRFNKIWDWLKLLLMRNEKVKSYSNYLDESEYENNRPVECISGACMLMKRDILTENQIFDPVFFMYGEDVELCYTTIHKGWTVYYLSSALVKHFGGESSKQESRTGNYSLSATYHLVEKRYGKVISTIFRLMSFIISLFKLTITNLILLFPLLDKNSKWAKRRLLYKQSISLAFKSD